ncbi:uncharacterized protein G2W53_029931 [Senna tora]|uniref:Uncharacterized protein n=1 Tax=Senna tora TaxID=362788 RepID=A0A834WB73_9FABA|nr:uncharacterized protein G2W53_029931 [Senna tora]
MTSDALQGMDTIGGASKENIYTPTPKREASKVIPIHKGSRSSKIEVTSCDHRRCDVLLQRVVDTRRGSDVGGERSGR